MGAERAGRLAEPLGKLTALQKLDLAGTLACVMQGINLFISFENYIVSVFCSFNIPSHSKCTFRSHARRSFFWRARQLRSRVFYYDTALP